MPNVNTGKPIRLKDGSIITITKSATDYVCFRVDEGTIQFTEGGSEVIHVAVGSALDPTAGLIQGDEQPTTLRFSFRPTTGGVTGTNDLRDLLEQDFSSGVGAVVSIKVQIPTYQGSATGVQCTFAKCFLNAGGFSYQGSGGGDSDRIAFEITDWEPLPTWATY